MYDSEEKILGLSLTIHLQFFRRLGQGTYSLKQADGTVNAVKTARIPFLAWKPIFQHAMSSAQPSQSLVSCDQESSMANDQTSFASDVELMALVPPVDNPTSEQSGKSSAADLRVTRRISTTAAHPTSVQKSSLPRDPFFTQNGKPSIVRRLILDS